MTVLCERFVPHLPIRETSLGEQAEIGSAVHSLPHRRSARHHLSALCESGPSSLCSRRISPGGHTRLFHPLNLAKQRTFLGSGAQTRCARPLISHVPVSAIPIINISGRVFLLFSCRFLCLCRLSCRLPARISNHRSSYQGPVSVV